MNKQEHQRPDVANTQSESTALALPIASTDAFIRSLGQRAKESDFSFFAKMVIEGARDTLESTFDLLDENEIENPVQSASITFQFNGYNGESFTGTVISADNFLSANGKVVDPNENEDLEYTHNINLEDLQHDAEEFENDDELHPDYVKLDAECSDSDINDYDECEESEVEESSEEESSESEKPVQRKRRRID